jgi:transcriptional regulator with XRE-family HTH domain
MATPREQLADMLRQSRIDAGYGSHGALARKLNVSRPVITKAENAAHPVPSDALLAAWAGATGVPLAGRPRIELHVIPEGTNVGLWVRSTWLPGTTRSRCACLPWKT